MGNQEMTYETGRLNDLLIIGLGATSFALDKNDYKIVYNDPLLDNGQALTINQLYSRYNVVFSETMRIIFEERDNYEGLISYFYYYITLLPIFYASLLDVKKFKLNNDQILDTYNLVKCYYEESTITTSETIKRSIAYLKNDIPYIQGLNDKVKAIFTSFDIKDIRAKIEAAIKQIEDSNRDEDISYAALYDCFKDIIIGSLLMVYYIRPELRRRVVVERERNKGYAYGYLETLRFAKENTPYLLVLFDDILTDEVKEILNENN